MLGARVNSIGYAQHLPTGVAGIRRDSGAAGIPLYSKLNRCNALPSVFCPWRTYNDTMDDADDLLDALKAPRVDETFDSPPPAISPPVVVSPPPAISPPVVISPPVACICPMFPSAQLPTSSRGAGFVMEGTPPPPTRDPRQLTLADLRGAQQHLREMNECIVMRAPLTADGVRAIRAMNRR